MEKDDDVKGSGNSYNTLFRRYDPRLGRWLSLDPKGHLFPDQSPYAGMDNNPVVKNDQNGDCTICDQLESFGIIFDRGLLGGDLLYMDGFSQLGVSGSPQYSPSALEKAIKDPFGVRGVQSISEQTVSSPAPLGL